MEIDDFDDPIDLSDYDDMEDSWTRMVWKECKACGERVKIQAGAEHCEPCEMKIQYGDEIE